MTSPCSFPGRPPLTPRTHDPQASITSPPPPLPPDPLDRAVPSPFCGLPSPTPPPPPLPPPPMKVAPPLIYGLEKSRLLKEALEKAGPAPKGKEDVKRLLEQCKDRFRGDLQWILFCADLPSLIQEGPQCGLVALWMAAAVLKTPGGIPLETLVRVAMERGYTMQGEMFSVADMGKLAQETLGCQAELLCGGLGGPNRDCVLKHLIAGQPLLVPYDEDHNHAPCQKKGHKAHWAVSAGQELALSAVGLRASPGQQPAADRLLTGPGCRWPGVRGASRRGAGRPLWPGPAPEPTGAEPLARARASPQSFAVTI